MSDQFLLNPDEEWIVLIKEAKAVGLTVEEIREFLVTDDPKRVFCLNVLNKE
ncbi:anti-repressor SinI family protein [Lentibacillus amyloliquefaciens]|uniref:anti-repressor SinI family protein n=1 Tax=Lentibacillus amyloliquefaciens TaxID=1472767 RepID=UPI0009E6FCD5|nr:anti-repressor SinI family protein [Lentibacillus amyloliquefaciens]